MHHPMGPNLRRSCTMECMKDITNTMDRHLSLSILSSSSWVTVVVYVRCRPALSPMGGSRATLMDIWRSPIGNLGVISHVIHNRKASSISGVFDIRSSCCSINPIPKWQFCRISQVPAKNPFFCFSSAMISWPSPMDTLSVGNFFRFLASSSIIRVGSDPAESRYRMALRLEDSSRISAIMSVTGAVNFPPSWLWTYLFAAIHVRSSRIHLTKHSLKKLPRSFSCSNLSS
mmetsp:Transcript_2620/g.5538  ORF Transcript_2620/g.5538 Transcript_2620/m.5538 type:complete len:230 (+) Transcript_2620:1527-2216(+)